MNEWRRGPCCAACGGGSSRAVRTHSAETGPGAIYYLTYVWACLVCGREWLDGSLERLNAWTAYTATLSAKGRDDVNYREDVNYRDDVNCRDELDEYVA